MPRQRLAGWEDAFAATLDNALAEPFGWGVHDCGLFACDMAEALTGRRPAAWLAGYTTEAELAAILDPRGGLEAAAAAEMMEFGAAEIPVLMAQRGDWLLVTVGNEVMMGLCAGDRAAVVGLEGLRYAPMAWATRAWAI